MRLKFRRDRRPDQPLESPLRFYPKYLAETLLKPMRWVSLHARLRLIYRKVNRDPRRLEYTDLALTPVTDEEVETRELFQSAAAQAYVVRIQRVEKLRRGAAA